jgi:predicted lipoprotein with Yx(FWY)xxD motif
MQRKAWIVAAILSTFAAGAVAQADTVVPHGIQVMAMGKTSMLTGPTGLTLYTFDPDADGKSTCNGPCAVKWPPLVPAADAKPVGAFTIIIRDDGTKQWAYKGKPLYYFQNDKDVMDETGDGVAGKWHVAML